jgi:hypothetical protein
VKEKAVNYDSMTPRIKVSRYKLEDVVEATRMSCIGRKPKLLCLHSTLTNNLVESNVWDEASKRMKQSLQRGAVAKFDEKWSKMLGIRQEYWKHPRGSRDARREGVSKERYESVVKKRFRKNPMYTQDNIEIRLLEPIDNGTIVEGDMVEEFIFVNLAPDWRSEYSCHRIHTYMIRQGPHKGSTIHQTVQRDEALHELGPSYNTMARTLATTTSCIHSTTQGT